MISDSQIDLTSLKNRAKDIVDKLNLPALRLDLEKLTVESGQPGLWTDEAYAKDVMSRMAGVRDSIESTERLMADLQSLEELLEMSKISEDESLNRDIKILYETLQRSVEKTELLTFLSGTYDSSEAVFSVKAGQGGTEAMDWASMLSRMYTRFFEKRGWSYETVEYSPGEEVGIKSVTYIVHGRFSYGYLKNEKGTHRLVRQSPFNADKLRQTSFAGVDVTPLLPEEAEVEIRDEDIEFEASRSSGAGGQNVNKVSTAVRIKHLPSGIVVECQTQRYQDANRKIAMQILKSKLWEIQEAKRQEELNKIKGSATIASWGHQIRSYVLHPYKLVKDLRTEYEETNPDSVLDGNLDGFIESELKYFAS
ncbi:TPA: peptide chain release factor 2 [Candidatus Collierbacteria bacterium]|uniref:Peptide chain release factor 2 n=1 Tax=Candidatus Collierbacteria bacterium GW2011_GWB2_44_22 TaxID=1618387 RepID=A0A0G1K7C0_9BACT|nr:MAG: Peptide chain release factor 2 [Candidatus Collierbacteria bacterium GW2011_GWA2_44_13]KKT49231.1 MAG: Peptide chain release factor 2 [Candidatus Collierbacteria bacterium GW2011_GWB1_44_197]KKT52207.1 MAG: Peptide chain release factor 2 [Candidatus Collierbacteria bacterium GW2011_GWB2_44_22]KKT62428.1 MAG: Peptide chain release factor 2 [Candidatus Collierbacteria bacterium GW2011_GWD1_44_27]KKT66850.1 MAG: Peptide chain release factor 2 [Candidatus Collierbacteria bacterium GW2011_GW